MVRATLNLFDEAYNDLDNKKMILLSDSCIPLYDFDHISRKLIGDNLTYLHHIYFHPLTKKSRYDALNNTKDINYKLFRKQSQWMTISRNDLKFILEFGNLDDYRTVFAPDEHYFINLFDKYQRKYLNRITTYVDWGNNNPTPTTYNNLDIELIEKARAT